MKQLTDAKEIGEHYNFLFEDGIKNQAQVWAMIWVPRKTENMSANVGTMLPATMVNGASSVPLNSSHAPKATLQIHFVVDEPKYIEFLNLELPPVDRTIEQYFRLAVLQAGGEIDTSNKPQEEQGNKGFVKTRFGNQTEDTIYSVYENGDFVRVEKLVIKGEQRSWELMNVASPRIKSIINIFQSQLVEGTLQTDLSKLL